MNAICKVFGKFAAEEDLYFLLTRVGVLISLFIRINLKLQVNKLVAERQGKNKGGDSVKQISEFTSRLTKRFYFFPGIKSEGWWSLFGS